MRTKITNTAVVALFGLALLLPPPGFAGRNGSNKAEGKYHNNSSQAKLRANLLPAPEIDEEIHGYAKYEKKSGKKGGEEKFVGHVRLPLPSSTLEIGTADVGLLFNTVFLLKIFGSATTGTPPVTTLAEKGSCILLLEKVVFDYEQGNVLEGVKAEYHVDLKEKSKYSGTPELKTKIGDCDVALSSTTGETPADGIPDVVEGDIAEVYAVQQTSTGLAPSGTLLLTGTFTAKHHDDDGDDDEEDED